MSKEHGMIFKFLAVTVILLLAFTGQAFAQAPDTPVLSSPSHGQVVGGDTVVLEWDAPAGADVYALYVWDLTGDTVEVVAENEQVFDNSYTLDGLSDEGDVYAWTVAAGNSGTGTFSDYAVPIAFVNGTDKDILPPTLTSPAHSTNAAGTSVNLEWEAPAGADAYVVIVWEYTEEDGYVDVVNNEPTSNTFYTLSGLSDDGDQYAWTVAAGNSTTGEWSDYAFPWVFVNGEEDVVEELEVVSVEAITETVPWGTEFEDLTFPETVEATLDDDSTTTVNVAWADEAVPLYDGEEAGDYVWEGDLVDLPDGVVNPDDEKAQLIVTVLTATYELTISIEGNGNTNPSEGTHLYDANEVVTITASPDAGWELYAWTGENVNDIPEAEVQEEVTTITMDGDKELTACFVDGTEEMHEEIIFQTTGFMGAGGTAEDLTGHPPYPPGFEIQIEAVPDDPERQTFTHWVLESQNPGILEAGNFFSNAESPLTWFRAPDFPFNIRAFFTTRTEWIEPGEFDYDHTNFDVRISGSHGVHYDFWDVSEVEEGRTLDFYFHAQGIPDRFKVYYGDERLFDETYFKYNEDNYKIFNSKWVSVYPDQHINPGLYVPDPKHHDWHNSVELSDWRIWSGRPGGKYESIIEKEEKKDVLLIKIEGRDDGTFWDYAVDLGAELPEGKFQVGDTVKTISGLILREEHNQESNEVWLMPHGTIMEVTGEPVHGDEYTWWPLEGFGRSGYAAEKFLGKFECSVTRGKDGTAEMFYHIPASCFTDHGWAVPVPTTDGKLKTSTWYDYDSPIYLDNHDFRHAAVDLIGPTGNVSLTSNPYNCPEQDEDETTPVYAIGSGLVKHIYEDETDDSGTYPKNNSLIVIEHIAANGNKFNVFYGHAYALDSLSVEDSVEKGKQIGTLRQSGSPTHLHFEVNNVIPPVPSNYRWGPIDNFKDGTEREGAQDPLKYLINNPGQ